MLAEGLTRADGEGAVVLALWRFITPEIPARGKILVAGAAAWDAVVFTDDWHALRFGSRLTSTLRTVEGLRRLRTIAEDAGL